MDQIWMCVHNFTLTVNDTFRSAAETRKDVNNLNEITKHMEANVSKDVMHGLDQKLYHLQLEVQGVLDMTFLSKDIMHGLEQKLSSLQLEVLGVLDMTLDQVLMKICDTSQENMGFMKTKFAELSDTTILLHVADVNIADLKKTMLRNNFTNVLKQTKANIHSFLNIKEEDDDCAFGTSFEEAGGAGVNNKVRIEKTMTYGDCTPRPSSSQWLLDGA